MAAVSSSPLSSGSSASNASASARTPGVGLASPAKSPMNSPASATQARHSDDLLSLASPSPAHNQSGNLGFFPTGNGFSSGAAQTFPTASNPFGIQAQQTSSAWGMI